MHLNSNETDVVFRIMRELTFDHDARSLRERVGPMLLELLDAHYLASYVWCSERGSFDERVAVNMSDENLFNYEAYYQFRDPITPLLQRRKKTTSVGEVISRRALERSEFFNDFLARDGLYFGINYYAYSAGRNIGDLRIWRRREAEDFSRREIGIMDAIGPAFTNAMRLALAREGRKEARLSLASLLEHVGTHAGLTPREKEIAASVMIGGSDLQIAKTHGISVSTVRTHIKNIYQKLGVSSRTQLTNRIILH